MTMSNRGPSTPSTPSGYELRIEGHLDPRWSTWFGGLAITHDDDGTTTLHGLVTHQSGYGLLAKVRDLGATLLSVRPSTPGPHDGGTAAAITSSPTGRDPSSEVVRFAGPACEHDIRSQTAPNP